MDDYRECGAVFSPKNASSNPELLLSFRPAGGLKTDSSRVQRRCGVSKAVISILGGSRTRALSDGAPSGKAEAQFILSFALELAVRDSYCRLHETNFLCG